MVPPQTDREVLTTLYNATGGPNWKNSAGWDTNADDLSDWYGVEVNGENRVVGLRLYSNNLQGMDGGLPLRMLRIALLVSTCIFPFLPKVEVLDRK